MLLSTPAVVYPCCCLRLLLSTHAVAYPCCCLPCVQDTVPSDNSIISMLLKANNKTTGTPLTDL